MLFYLGTHKPSWLAERRFENVALFVSRRELQTRNKLKRALAPWVMDSGGFTELSLHGRWTTNARDYVRDVREIIAQTGPARWISPQDWMCEPEMLGKTGKSIAEHQLLTVDNLVELRALAPDLPIVPVLQGWALADYERCVDLYRRAGVDLEREPVVGVGTVCRRQDTREAEVIMRTLASHGLRLHGFGFKTKGLLQTGNVLLSSDSMAWSLDARRAPPLPGHDKPGPNRRFGHKSCANCQEYALRWRARLFDTLKRGGIDVE